MSEAKLSRTIIPESHYPILEDKCYPIVCTIRKDGLISANPVSMLWEDGKVRFSTVKNRMKYKNLARDPRLTLCISSPDDPLYYIEIRGRADLQDDLKREFIDRVAQKYLGMEQYPYDNPGDERVTVTIVPEQVSARGIKLTEDEQGKPVKLG